LAVTNFVRSVPVAALALFLAGVTAANVHAEPDFGFGAQVHIMPLVGDPSPNGAGAPHLNYYGGRVISNARVVVVFWGPNVNSTVRSQIGGFYSAVTDSPYMDWLSEYNTTITAVDGQPGTNQLIGRGSLRSSVTITPSNTSMFLRDSDIQSEINNQINGGTLPLPDADTLYMVYFPPGIVISLDSYYSCQQFCAYHGTFTRGGASVPYGVMPDFGPGSGCDLGCGSNPSMFNNMTSVSSHEMVESITDMEVGLATALGRPLAWYDPVNGEIGDICNGIQGSIAGYTVQRQWSNQVNDCIVSRTASNDFSIALNPTSQSTSVGSTASYTVNTAITSGTAQAISLSVSGLPSSITGSFNPNPISSGGSSTLTLTVSSSAAPAAYNFTVTGTGTFATRSTGGTLIVTGGDGGLVNGDFERGDLSGWSVTGAAAVVPVPHSGNYSALVGSTIPSGDSALSQTFDMPVTATTLSLWYAVFCPDTVDYDWAEVTIRDNVTSNTIAVVPRTCPWFYAWTPASLNVVSMRGHSVTLTLKNHDDGYFADPTFTLYDDVTLQ